MGYQPLTTERSAYYAPIMQVEQLIIQKIASRPSTEELIFFIAEDDAITLACSELQRKIASNNKKELKKIDALCRTYHMSLAHLTGELNHIQNIFAPQETLSDDHKILGLSAGANIAEIKQAYRKLSIKYHPDTSDKNDTAKFIELTKAYQRIITSTTKENKKNPSPSSSAWRYRKGTPPPQQRKKKYIYLFSLVTGAVILVIVSISIHYQKRAMLNNIRKISHAPSPAAHLAEKTPAIVKNQPTGIYVSDSSTPAVQPQVIGQKPRRPLPTGKMSEQSSHQVSQDDVTLVPLTPENMDQVQHLEFLKSLEHLTFKEQTKVEVENLAPSISPSHVSSEINDSKKSSAQKSAQEEKEAASIVSVEKKSDLFADILEQKQAPKQKETSSVFPEARYHKDLVVQPRERKIRTKKLSAPDTDAPDTEQTAPSISIQQSLREFVQSYTAVYMTRDIEKFSLFFTKGALENDEPFTNMHAKYKKLFNSTQSIDYSIDLLGTDIQGEGTTATLTGRFRVQLVYSPDKIKSSSGTITFFLIRKDRTYKIQAISYHLDPKL